MADVVTPEKLRDKQDRNELFYLIDTRPETDYENWHIKDAVNFPFTPSGGLNKESFREFQNEKGFEEGDEIIALCAKGVSSHKLAERLEEMGFEDVKSLRGGMREWSGLYDVVPVASRNPYLKVIQLQRRAKGCIGYIVGSSESGEAAAIDVSRYTDKFLEAASERGFKITHVFDTHVHADHISGGRELAKKLKVPYHLGKAAEKRISNYSFQPVGENEVVKIGGIDVKAIHTPGHTSEMTSLLIGDEALITGDSLFVDSIGRTELEFQGDRAGEGASMQYESLNDKVMVLPDKVKILPGHFSVTEDGRTPGVTPGTPIFSTVGYLRTNNQALRMSEEEFLEYMFENIPDKPPNYEEIIAVNLGEKELSDEVEAIELELGPNRCAASEESMLDS